MEAPLGKPEGVFHDSIPGENGVGLRFRAEFFNIFNHPNFGCAKTRHYETNGLAHLSPCLFHTSSIYWAELKIMQELLRHSSLFVETEFLLLAQALEALHRMDDHSTIENPTFFGSAQESVKVLNWRGFLKPAVSGFTGSVGDHGPRVWRLNRRRWCLILEPLGPFRFPWRLRAKLWEACVSL